MSNDGRAYPYCNVIEKLDCGICGEDMPVERGVMGATGFAEAMAHRSHLHDSFRCKNIDEQWHLQVDSLQEEIQATRSNKIRTILREEISEILKTRKSTIEYVSKYC